MRCRWQRQIAAIAIAVALSGGAAACGADTRKPATPIALDKSLAPPAIGADHYRLYPNTDQATIAAFANAGPTSLVDDGGVWEIRRADRLVGTLQISTLSSRVNLANPSARSAIISDIVPGGGTSIAVQGVEVATATVGDRTVYLWFGRQLYEVMVLRGIDMGDQPESLLTDVVTHQRSVPAWEPLPPDA